MFTRKRITGFVFAILALVGIGAVVLIPGSGATFTASDTGRVDGSTATLSLNLSDPTGNSGMFQLNFTNLSPGHSLSQSFTVKNTGTIAAAVKVGQPLGNTSLNVPVGQHPNPAQLKLQVDGYLAYTPVNALPSTVGLGNLNAGEERTYTVRLSLDSAADNNWQGVTAGSDVTVTLTGL